MKKYYLNIMKPDIVCYDMISRNTEIMQVSICCDLYLE